MPFYASANNNVAGSPAVAATFKTLVSLTAATATLARGKVYDVIVGTDGTPADNAVTWDVARQTTLGTGTTNPPNPTDTLDAAARTVGTANYTVEPTIASTASLFQMGGNQRASFRWVASPGGELVIPAVNVNGLAARVKSAAYTGTATATVHHSE